ncbi:hypothetical protein EDF63_2577 [Curtobacterium sp. JUb34]|nr:hypothetical protein EDF63_2577 [Curtobacterium sp. JUb34]
MPSNRRGSGIPRIAAAVTWLNTWSGRSRGASARARSSTVRGGTAERMPWNGRTRSCASRRPRDTPRCSASRTRNEASRSANGSRRLAVISTSCSRAGAAEVGRASCVDGPRCWCPCGGVAPLPERAEHQGPAARDRGISPARGGDHRREPPRCPPRVGGAVVTGKGGVTMSGLGEGAAATRSAMMRAGGLPGCRGRAPRHFARSRRRPSARAYAPYAPHAPLAAPHAPHRAAAPGRHSRGPSGVGGLQ